MFICFHTSNKPVPTPWSCKFCQNSIISSSIYLAQNSPKSILKKSFFFLTLQTKLWICLWNSQENSTLYGSTLPSHCDWSHNLLAWIHETWWASLDYTFQTAWQWHRDQSNNLLLDTCLVYSHSGFLDRSRECQGSINSKLKQVRTDSRWELTGYGCLKYWL